MGNNSFSDALHNDPAGFIRRLIRGISRGDHLRENREFFQFLLHNEGETNGRWLRLEGEKT